MSDTGNENIFYFYSLTLRELTKLPQINLHFKLFTLLKAKAEVNPSETKHIPAANPVERH